MIQELHAAPSGRGDMSIKELANTLREAVSENNRKESFQEEKQVQQTQRGWDQAILKATRRR